MDKIDFQFGYKTIGSILNLRKLEFKNCTAI